MNNLIGTSWATDPHCDIRSDLEGINQMFLEQTGKEQLPIREEYDILYTLGKRWRFTHETIVKVLGNRPDDPIYPREPN